MKAPKKNSEKIVIDNGFKKVTQKFFKTKKNTDCNFLTIGNSGGERVVMILALDTDDKIIYLDEYRYGPEKYVSNFPAGIVDSGESSREAAQRELQEETGYTSENIKFLGSGILGAHSDDYIDYYLALDAKFVGNNSIHDTEFINVHTLSNENFKNKILTGNIESPLTIHCYMLANLKKYL